MVAVSGTFSNPVAWRLASGRAGQPGQVYRHLSRPVPLSSPLSPGQPGQMSRHVPHVPLWRLELGTGLASENQTVRKQG
jgi:hypothetical protein